VYHGSLKLLTASPSFDLLTDGLHRMDIPNTARKHTMAGAAHSASGNNDEVNTFIVNSHKPPTRPTPTQVDRCTTSPPPHHTLSEPRSPTTRQSQNHRRLVYSLCSSGRSLVPPGGHGRTQEKKLGGAKCC
jgi:hypothetical protein